MAKGLLWAAGPLLWQDRLPGICSNRVTAWNIGKLIAEFLACEVDFVELLQIRPNIGTHSEILTEPQRSIAGNPSEPAQNVGDTGRRHLDRARQFAQH
jgi:hypothetical protein